jgi:hypothetical protein
MFALQSCQGFSPNTYHMWCCTKRQCNIHYTEQAVQDLGFSLPFAMEFLTCHDMNFIPSPPASSESGRTKLLVPLLALGLAAAISLALVLLWRQRNACQGEKMKGDELQKVQSIHEPEMHRQRMQNGQAEVEFSRQKRQMDLQAKTEHNDIVSVGSIPNGKSVPSKLTVRLMQICRCSPTGKS